MKKLIIGLCLIPLLSVGQTTNEVLNELKKQDVKFPEIVLAQSLLETGWYLGYITPERKNTSPMTIGRNQLVVIKEGFNINIKVGIITNF